MPTLFAGLVAASLRGRGLVSVLALLLLLLGALSLRELPVDVLPELTRPTVTVQTEAVGLAPEDVESQISQPLEAALAGLPQIGRLRSVSSAGLSVIYAEFDWGSDPWRNRQLVAERIDSLRAQLDPLATPRIGPLTSLMGEVLLLALQSQDGSTGAQPLRERADWQLRPALLAVPGVAQVLVIGGAVKQYEVRPDPQRLQRFDLRLADLGEAIRGFGSNSGLGLAQSGGSEIALRGIGRPFALDDLAQTAVAWRGDGPIRLGQVAELAVGERLPRGAAGYNGAPAVILAVHKQPGVDTLELSSRIASALAQAQAGWPADLRLHTVFRQADFIEESLGTLREALLHGALIVGLVLLLFLAGGRASLITLAALPVSLALAVLVLALLGFSINTMTLGGLAIAIGELVDDAVVGVENVLRRMRLNAGRAEAEPWQRLLVAATVEVRSGILYATLLIVLAFAPLFALGGLEGRLVSALGAAYVAAILASLLVALTLTPALAALGLVPNAPPPERAWLRRIKPVYAAALRRVLAAPAWPLTLSAALLLASLALAWQLPRSFLPGFNERSLTINLLLPPGTALASSDALAASAERLVLAVPEVLSVGRRSGRAEEDEHAEGVHYSELDLRLREVGRPRAAVVADLRQRLSVLPASLVIGQPISHRLDHLLSGVRAPLVVKVFGEDLAELRRLAGLVAQRLATLPGLVDVQVEALGEVPQLRLRIEPRLAAQYGVSPPRLQQTLAALGNGEPLSRIVEGERRYDLVLRLPPEALDPARLGRLQLDTPAGAVPLAWLAQIETGLGPGSLLRENQQRRIGIAAYRGSGRFDLAEQRARALLAELPLPPGYHLQIEGEQAAQRAASARIALLALASLLLMAALLYLRYRAWSLVLIVLGNLPLALIGGVLALAVTGTPLSVASLVGFVTLAGIAARNGILKISRYRQLRREGLAFGVELLVQGALERFTPVLMTALIAAAALLPLLFAADAPGKELLHPVALVIFGGVISSTLLDAFLTPLLVLRSGALRGDLRN